MTVGMIPVSGLGGQRQSQEYQAGRQNVTSGFQSVGHQRCGRGHQTRDDLHNREQGAYDHAAERDLPADAYISSVASRDGGRLYFGMRRGVTRGRSGGGTLLLY